MSAVDTLVERARNTADNIGRELSANSMLPPEMSGVSDLWAEEGAIVLREAASALEASEAKIAALTAERDALREKVERAAEEAYEAAAQVALTSRCDTAGDRRRAETIAGGIRLLASAARAALRQAEEKQP